MPVEQELIRADEERAGAAGGIKDAESGDAGKDGGDFPRLVAADVRRRIGSGGRLIRLLTSAATSINQFSHRLADDVIHDVGGRVIDATGFLHLRLVIHHGAVAVGEADDFAEELLIDLAEHVGGENGEFVGTVGKIEIAQDATQ